MRPLSVGIAAFNEEKTIVTTVYSILNQENIDDLEILVCANGCYDATEEVIRDAFGSAVRLAKIPIANKAIAWRTIQELAKNNTLIYADADIVIAPDSLGRIVEAFEANPSVTVIGGMGIAHTDGRAYSTKVLHPFPKNHRCFQGALYGMDVDAFHRHRVEKKIPNMGPQIINEDAWVGAVAGDSLLLNSLAQFVYSPPDIADLIGVEARIKHGRSQSITNIPDCSDNEETRPSIIKKVHTFLSQEGIAGKRDLLAHKLLQRYVSLCAKYYSVDSWNRAESSKQPISYEAALKTITEYRKRQQNL